jgi:hypothetical protein
MVEVFIEDSRGRHGPFGYFVYQKSEYRPQSCAPPATPTPATPTPASGLLLAMANTTPLPHLSSPSPSMPLSTLEQRERAAAFSAAAAALQQTPDVIKSPAPPSPGYVMATARPPPAVHLADPLVAFLSGELLEGLDDESVIPADKRQKLLSLLDTMQQQRKRKQPI